MYGLHNMSPTPGSRHRRKRLGCGESSGHGKTSGKGHKGQKARAGAHIRPGYEGGQMPLIRRLPKKGFNNGMFRKDIAIVNLRDLAVFSAGDVINEASLREKNLVKGVNDGVKLLGTGEVSAKFTVQLPYVSEAAKAKILAAGGSVEAPAKAEAAAE
jgi:large subunit ribosomal protein L15